MASYMQEFPSLQSDAEVCCAYGCGTISLSHSPMKSPIFGTSKMFCCLQGIDVGIDKGCLKKGSQAGKGLCSVFQKCACCIQSVSLGHCSILICDKTYCGPGPIGENAPAMDADLSFMNDVFWIAYLGIGGVGLTNDIMPICVGESTCCCIEHLTQTVKVVDPEMGILHKRIKTCCLVTEWTCPFKENKGCMIFTNRIGAAARELNKPKVLDNETAAFSTYAPPQSPGQHVM